MMKMNEEIDQLAMRKSVRWCDHELRGECGNVVRKALEFEVESRTWKGRRKNRGSVRLRKKA